MSEEKEGKEEGEEWGRGTGKGSGRGKGKEAHGGFRGVPMERRCGRKGERERVSTSSLWTLGRMRQSMVCGVQSRATRRRTISMQVHTSNMFEGLEVSDEDVEELDDVTAFPSLHQSVSEKLETPRMHRWERPSQASRKTRTAGGQPKSPLARHTCGCCKPAGNEADECGPTQNLHYLGTNTVTSEPMISHILGGPRRTLGGNHRSHGFGSCRFSRARKRRGE